MNVMLCKFYKLFIITTFLIFELYIYTSDAFFAIPRTKKVANLKHSIARRDVTPYCYECKDCNTVPVSTSQLVNCPGFCYAALASEDKDEEVTVVRGCIPEIPSDGRTACDAAMGQYILKHTEGFFNISSCMECSSSNAGACNGKTFIMPGVNCYKCTDCDKVGQGTSKTVCPAECCYRAAFMNSTGSKYYSVRGCRRLREPAQTCESTCDHLREKHNKRYPEGNMQSCLRCSKGDSNECNYHEFNFSPVVPRPVSCYNCTGCPKVTDTTNNIHCENPRCCYSVGFREFQGHGVDVVRGCAKPRDGRTCDQTCEDITSQHGNVNVEKCIQCQQNDFDECNRYTYIVPAPPPLINLEKLIACYSCRNCNQIVPRTKLLWCAPTCCFRAVLIMSDPNKRSVIRGCTHLEKEGLCGTTCDLVTKRHESSEPKGRVAICTTCGAKGKDRCNEDTFPDMESNHNEDKKVVKCYKCKDKDKNKDCHRTTDATPTVECGDSKCCYSSYIRDTPDGEYYVERGCGKLEGNRPCAYTCRDLKNKYLFSHPTGEYVNCWPCRDKDKCNDLMRPIYNPKVPPGSKQEGTMCYSCEGRKDKNRCFSVDLSTDTLPCRSASCCYAARMLDVEDGDEYVNRGCLTDRSCKRTCEHVSDDHLWTHAEGVFYECHQCAEADGPKCNSKVFGDGKPVVKPTLPPGTDYILCYECEECNTVTSEFLKGKAKISDSLCYILLITSTKSRLPSATRGKHTFANGIPNKPCTEIEDTYSKVEANKGNEIHHCVTCGDKEHALGCNSRTFNPGPPVPLKGEHMCYNCTQCNKVETSTPKVQCEDPKCCYTALVQNELPGEISAIRGCKRSSLDCDDTCQLVQQEYMAAHPDGLFNFCNPCEKHTPNGICNDNDFLNENIGG